MDKVAGRPSGRRPRSATLSFLSPAQFSEEGKRVLARWASHRVHNCSGAKAGDLAPFALTAHELLDILSRLKTATASDRRRRRTVPWNAALNGRLISLVLRRVDCVAQPALEIIVQTNGGFMVRALDGECDAGVLGLRRALAAIETAPRLGGPRLHALVYLRTDIFFVERAAGESPASAAAKRPSRRDPRRDLSDIEHAVEVSIDRIERAKDFVDDLSWRKAGPSEGAQKAVREVVRHRGENDEAWKVKSWSETGLVCVVAKRGAGVGTRGVEVVHTSEPFRSFKGDERASRNRLSAVLGHSLQRKKMFLNAPQRCTTVLQSAWIASAIKEGGDCAAERASLARAFEIAEALRAAEPESAILIALARRQPTSADQWRQTAACELERVLEVRGWPARKRISKRKEFRALQKTYAIDQHEIGEWRRCKSGDVDVRASSKSDDAVVGAP